MGGPFAAIELRPRIDRLRGTHGTSGGGRAGPRWQPTHGDYDAEASRPQIIRSRERRTGPLSYFALREHLTICVLSRVSTSSRIQMAMNDHDLDTRLYELGRQSARPVRPDFREAVWARIERRSGATLRSLGGLVPALFWRVAPSAFALIAGSLAGLGAVHAHDRDVLDAFDPSGPYALVSLREGREQ